MKGGHGSSIAKFGGGGLLSNNAPEMGNMMANPPKMSNMMAVEPPLSNNAPKMGNMMAVEPPLSNNPLGMSNMMAVEPPLSNNNSNSGNSIPGLTPEVGNMMAVDPREEVRRVTNTGSSYNQPFGGGKGGGSSNMNSRPNMGFPMLGNRIGGK